MELQEKTFFVVTGIEKACQFLTATVFYFLIFRHRESEITPFFQVMNQRYLEVSYQNSIQNKSWNYAIISFSMTLLSLLLFLALRTDW